MPVVHCLMAVEEADYRDLRVVYSHPEALAQCATFIDRHKLEPRPFYDTAGAAKMLARENPRAAAVIASPLAADLYDLAILKEGIDDGPPSSTRFVLIAKEARQAHRREVLDHLRRRPRGRQPLRRPAPVRRLEDQPDPHRLHPPARRPRELQLLPRLRGLAGGQAGGPGAEGDGVEDHRAEVPRQLPRSPGARSRASRSSPLDMATERSFAETLEGGWRIQSSSVVAGRRRADLLAGLRARGVVPGPGAHDGPGGPRRERRVPGPLPGHESRRRSPGSASRRPGGTAARSSWRTRCPRASGWCSRASTTGRRSG